MYASDNGTPAALVQQSNLFFFWCVPLSIYDVCLHPILHINKALAISNALGSPIESGAFNLPRWRTHLIEKGTIQQDRDRKSKLCVVFD